VSGADGIGDAEGKSRDGKRQVSREEASFKFMSRFWKIFQKKLAIHSRIE